MIKADGASIPATSVLSYSSASGFINPMAPA